MNLALVLLLALAQADAQPAALVLPLRATGSVTLKQASGVRFTLTSSVEKGGFAKVLSDSKDDERQAERCQLDAACLRELAAVRGADVVLAGALAPAPDGLRLELVAAASPDVVRTTKLSLHGNPEDDAADIDRALRLLLNPDALRGAIFVGGEEGAQVFIDGNDIGALPLKQQLNDVLEGEHEVVVKRNGLERFRRTVQVRHAETTMVRAQLLDDARIANELGERDDAGPPVAAIVVTSVGATLLASGVVCGVFSWLAAQEAEARAKEQQLLLPRDEGLLFRGTALAWSANGLYLLGAAGVGAGVALWMMPAASTDDSDGAAAAAP